MATPTDDKDVFPFEEFLGLRNTVAEQDLDASDLVVARNVDVTDAKKVRRRAGFGEPVYGTSSHSLWSDGNIALFVSGGALHRLNPDYTTGSLAPVSAAPVMYYASVAGRAYFSNGVDSGVVTPGGVRTWGIARPFAQPTASVIGGTLPAGTYQFAVTYLRDDGQESGTGLAGSLTLAAAGGIEFSLIPISPDPSVVGKRLYVSPPNGDLLYEQMFLAADEETATLVSYRAGTLALATQFLSAPPPGEHLAYFAGRVLLARSNWLYPSEPFAPELFDLRRTYSFTGRITLVAPVDDGVYLGTEGQIVWLPGKDPEKWEYLPRAAYGAIAGTLAYGDAEDVAEGATGPAVYFASTEGVCVGLNGGVFRNLTGERFNYPVTSVGAGLVRKSRGSVQYLATLKGAAVAGNTAF